jgi:hypothetical protein
MKSSTKWLASALLGGMFAVPMSAQAYVMFAQENKRPLVSAKENNDIRKQNNRTDVHCHNPNPGPGAEAPVPEPATLMLMLTGLAGFAGFKKLKS